MVSSNDAGDDDQKATKRTKPQSDPPSPISGIPKKKTTHWTARAEPAAWAGAVIAGLTGASKSVSDYHSHQWSMGTVLTCLALVFCPILALFTIRAAKVKDADSVNSQDKYQIGLRSVLQTIVHMLHHQYICRESRRTGGVTEAVRPVAIPKDIVRATVYFRQGAQMVQEIPYAGGQGGKAGRSQSVHVGIVGLAVTNKKHQFITLRDQQFSDEQFVQLLVRKFHYEESQAREIRKDRRSWAAIPIKDTDGEAVAVVFFDSSDARLLTSNADLIMQSCKAVSEALTSA